MMMADDPTHVLDHGYVSLVEAWGSDRRIVEDARMSTDGSFRGWGPTCRDCAPKGFQFTPKKFLPHECCRTCGRHTEVWAGDETFIEYLWKEQHTSPFEGCGATFEIMAPIMVFREWHRHRTQSYNELSARYTPLPDVNYVPSVERCMRTSSTNKQAQAVAGAQVLTSEAVEQWLKELEDCYTHIQQVYERGLEIGIPKELARLPVPVGRYTKMRASANLLN